MASQLHLSTSVNGKLVCYATDPFRKWAAWLPPFVNLLCYDNYIMRPYIDFNVSIVRSLLMRHLTVAALPLWVP
jgi:hypothetical protein